MHFLAESLGNGTRFGIRLILSPRLIGQQDTTARREFPGKSAENVNWLVPEHGNVDREEPVERAGEFRGGQRFLDSAGHQMHAAAGDRDVIPSRGHVLHRSGLIEADNPTFGNVVGNQFQGDTGTEADFQNSGCRFQVHQLDRPFVTQPIRFPIGHDRPGEPAHSPRGFRNWLKR